MIDVEIAAEGYDLSNDLESRIRSRIGGLDEFMPELDRGHVTVSWEGGPHHETRLRARVTGAGKAFEASDTDWQADEALVKVTEKLAVQIKRSHAESVEERNR